MQTFADARSAAEVVVDKSIKAEVLAGIDKLNEIYGPNWVDHVDPRTLSMSNCSECMLGQLFGEYHHGLEVLEIENGSDFGFDTPNGNYMLLDEAWKKIIWETT